MPELPEVETVRRGLQPVMEGARIVKAEARRGDLRRPLPKDFVKRLEGRSVTGLGRRAKYLLADLSSGEVLHRARLSPKRQASTIATRAGAPTARAEVLVGAIKAVLQDAIKAGGSSLRDHRQTDGELGYFQHHFRVYDREGARCVTPGCKGTVKRIVQSGRSTFYCPTCQK